MPDGGTNGYISLAPNGTVVVPNNLTPSGVIEAGDLASHADVNSAVAAGVTTAEDYTDSAVSGLATNDDLATLASEVVYGAGLQISDEYSVDINEVGSPEHFWTETVDVAELATAVTWRVIGDFIGTAGALAVNGPSNLGGGVLQLSFTAQTTGPSLITGTYFFRLLYTTS